MQKYCTSICNLKYSVPEVIFIVFYNGSNYDCYFIINKLAKKFKEKINCLRENTEKYITILVLIEKEPS